MITMDIDYKIKNIREALNNNDLSSVNDKKFFNAILDVLQDISNEIDELNEMICV